MKKESYRSKNNNNGNNSNEEGTIKAEQLAATEPVVSDSVNMYLKQVGKYKLLTSQQEIELAKKIERGNQSKAQLDEAAANGVTLGRSDMRRLNRSIEIGKEAKELFINSNLRLVVSIAKRYMGKGLSLADLIQEGNLGLITAVSKFDYRKGFKFSTYATWWIRQAITRALSDKGRAIRLPVHVGELITKMNRVERAFTEEEGREPSIEEVAAKMGLTPKRVMELKKISQEPLSMDAPVGEEGDTVLGDMVEDDSVESPFEVVSHSALQEHVHEALDCLSERERQVIILRYGLDDNHPRSLAEVGREFGVCRERARQIESKALHKLGEPRDSVLAKYYAS